MLFSRSQDFCAFPEDLLDRLFYREQGTVPEFAEIKDTPPPPYYATNKKSWGIDKQYQ